MCIFQHTVEQYTEWRSTQQHKTSLWWQEETVAQKDYISHIFINYFQSILSIYLAVNESKIKLYFFPVN